MEPKLVTARVKAKNGEQLTEEEEYLLGEAVNATLRMMENTHYHYRQGFFDEEEFKADLNAWRYLMKQPEFKAQWAATRLQFSEEFRTKIDEIVH